MNVKNYFALHHCGQSLMEGATESSISRSLNLTVTPNLGRLALGASVGVRVLHFRYGTKVLSKRFREFIYLALVLTGFAVFGIGQAAARPAFSSVVVDARNGAIIKGENIDAPRHPASLTKMMTLYLLFQDLKAGRVKMSTPLRVSARAASMAPSKLGLRAGSTITVHDAIYALVIKSANDAAATVGENLGGSESAFALRMTRTAHAIGMNRTVFRNASGLPNPAQLTTARDMATLGLRLMRDFPQYYPYFRATSFNYRGRHIRTHNPLVGRFDGTDGIKTGYIAAAGYNLVTSTRRGNKRVVGVVLGARSNAARSAYMMAMITRAFPACKDGSTVAAVAGSSKGAVNPITLASSASATVAEPEAKALAVDNESLAAVAADASDTPVVLEAAMTPKKKTVIEGNIVDGLAVASLPSNWTVQISDFKKKGDADAVINTLKKSGAANMSGKNAFAVAAKRGRKMVYQVVIKGYSQGEAKSSCARVAATGMACAVIPPNS
jgi:D-alanyl-D-alanine carboxypeptidase